MKINHQRFDRFLKTYINKYKIFIGSNDYDVNLSHVIEISKDIQGIDTILSISGGWYSLLVDQSPTSFIFYDINPAMLVLYRFIWDMISISSSRRQFIERLFCREISIGRFTSNRDVISYLSQDINRDTYIETLSLLESRNIVSAAFYESFILRNVIDTPKEGIVVYPTYIYRDDADRFILGRKLRCTQSDGTLNKFFTTFYYDHISPFDTDENYMRLRMNISRIENPRFILMNINTLSLHWKDIVSMISGDFIMYIDGIDDEMNYYLKGSRDELFREIASLAPDRKVYVISTKSGMTTIDHGHIIRSDNQMHINDKAYMKSKLNVYNTSHEYDAYSYEIINML